MLLTFNVGISFYFPPDGAYCQNVSVLVSHNLQKSLHLLQQFSDWWQQRATATELLNVNVLFISMLG